MSRRDRRAELAVTAVIASLVFAGVLGRNPVASETPNGSHASTPRGRESGKANADVATVEAQLN